MPDIDLHLLLSSDRDRSGVLIARDRQSGRELRRFHALGRGSAGAGDAQMRANGNTPAGTYSVTKLERTDGWSQRSYGPNGALRLKPLSGVALDAANLMNRSGLLIHGGELGSPDAKGNAYWRGNGELRATHGCVRLSDQSFRELVDLLQAATHDSARSQSTQVDVKLTVTEFDASIAVPPLR